MAEARTRAAGREALAAAVAYLRDAGWRQDGDDPGMWQGPHRGLWLPVWDALAVQWSMDGIRPGEADQPR